MNLSMEQQFIISMDDSISELLIDTDKDRLEDVIQLLVDKLYVESSSEFMCLVEQGSICINEEIIEDIDYVLYNWDILKIGEKKSVKIIK